MDLIRARLAFNNPTQARPGPLLIFLPVSPITVAALLASAKAGIPHTLVGILICMLNVLVWTMIVTSHTLVKLV